MEKDFPKPLLVTGVDDPRFCYGFRFFHRFCGAVGGCRICFSFGFDCLVRDFA